MFHISTEVKIVLDNAFLFLRLEGSHIWILHKNTYLILQDYISPGAPAPN